MTDSDRAAICVPVIVGLTRTALFAAASPLPPSTSGSAYQRNPASVAPDAQIEPISPSTFTPVVGSIPPNALIRACSSLIWNPGVPWVFMCSQLKTSWV